MAGVNAPVIHAHAIVSMRPCDPHLLLEAMVPSGKQSVMHGQEHIHIVPIRSAFTLVNACL